MNYTDKNWKIIEKALKKSGYDFGNANIEQINQLAKDIRDYIVSNAAFNETHENGIPVYTGNLLDSTGVGLYMDGRLIATAVGNEVADIPQTYKGQEYYGRNLLQDALNQTLDIGHGLVLRIFSASPIASKINTEGSPWDRGRGYFDDIIAFATKKAQQRFKL